LIPFLPVKFRPNAFRLALYKHKLHMINLTNHRRTDIALIPALIGLMSLVCPAAPKGQMLNPDFTKGGIIPAEASHDWTLGATGARGWIFSEGFATSKAR
jgi:hypothetical protein